MSVVNVVIADASVGVRSNYTTEVFPVALNANRAFNETIDNRRYPECISVAAHVLDLFPAEITIGIVVECALGAANLEVILFPDFMADWVPHSLSSRLYVGPQPGRMCAVASGYSSTSAYSGAARSGFGSPSRTWRNSATS